MSASEAVRETALVPVQDTPTTPAVTSAPVRVSPFTRGMLLVGLGVGGPAALVSSLFEGPVWGLVAFPAAVAIVLFDWLRSEGRAEVGRQLGRPLVRRRELWQAIAGGLVMLTALAWIIGGGR